MRIYPPVALSTFVKMLRACSSEFKNAVVRNGDGCYEVWTLASEEVTEADDAPNT